MDKRKERQNRKENVFGIIGSAFKGYFKNLSLALPFVFLLVILILFLAVFLFSTLGSIQTLQFNTTNALWILLIAGIFLLALIFSASFLFSGAIAMSQEIVSKKKTSLTTLFSAGKKFWFRFLSATIILVLIAAIPFFILIIIANTFVQNMPETTQILTILSITFLTMLLFIFFELAPYFLVTKNLRVFASIKESFGFAKENYGELLLLTIIFSIAGILVNLIPYIGQIINLLLIAPAQVLTFIIYINARKK